MSKSPKLYLNKIVTQDTSNEDESPIEKATPGMKLTRLVLIDRLEGRREREQLVVQMGRSSHTSAHSHDVLVTAR